MNHNMRDCPDCGLKREFSQPHASVGGCPDGADGLCPEWFCASCGAALLIGLLPVFRPVARGRVSHLGRVA